MSKKRDTTLDGVKGRQSQEPGKQDTSSGEPSISRAENVRGQNWHSMRFELRSTRGITQAPQRVITPTFKKGDGFSGREGKDSLPGWRNGVC